MSMAEKLKAYMGSVAPKITKPPAIPPEGGQYPLEFNLVLGGAPMTTPYGTHMVADNSYSSSQIHGGLRLSQVFDISPEIMELMTRDRAFRCFDFRRAAFIDTETTGLAGGTGTVAFLIGVGYFEEDQFRLRQYFLRDFDEEAAALYSIAEQMENFDYLVSFNGRAFDIPLLSTRFMLNRMTNPLEEMPNLDLLFLARRLFRERLKSVSLSSLEKNLFDLRRVGDIPGYEIPSVYFRYLRDKNPFPLKPIFHHNRIDILSMVTLAAKSARALENPFCPENCRDEDYYCLGRIFADTGDMDRAIQCYTRALEISGVRAKAFVDLSLIYKRSGHFVDAEELWLEMVQQGVESPFALVELAKYYEHKVKDYNRALQFTQKALELSSRGQEFSRNTSNSEDIRELYKRLERIERKRRKGEKVS